KRTWIIKDGKPQAGYVTAVGLYGDNIRIGHGSKGGWDTFDLEYRITKSKDNILYEIDKKPALQLYKEYLKEQAAELPASALLFPLALRAKSGDAKQIVRTVLGVDEAEQSMTFAGDMPEGYLAQFMRANFDRLIQGAAGAALLTKASTNQTASLVVAISCVGRRLVLKERTKEELEMVLNILPNFAKQIGFYSYGEISPFSNGVCELHNQTMTLTVISEPGYEG
ncbi:MAG TPA: FIST C-terminal domain-containing protein, partial [Anaerolineales bacterium]|nr:FIST C-terminal domain-containing protein [Anaerolineales bacterium]